MLWIIGGGIVLLVFIYAAFDVSARLSEKDARYWKALERLKDACLDPHPETDETHSATRYAQGPETVPGTGPGEIERR